MEENRSESSASTPEFPTQRDLFFQEDGESLLQAQPDADKPQAEDPVSSIPAGKENAGPDKELPPAPAVKKLQHLTVSAQATAGQLLSQARSLAAMDLQQVADITRIRLEYLQALEEDDKANLPSSRVFVQSDIRTCMDLYQLDRESKERVMERFLEDEKEEETENVPEKILEHIGKDGQISQEEAHRVRVLCIYGAVILFLLLSLTVTSIIAFSIRNSRKETAPDKTVKTFERKNIEKLLAPQIPDPVILEIPREKR